MKILKFFSLAGVPSGLSKGMHASAWFPPLGHRRTGTPGRFGFALVNRRSCNPLSTLWEPKLVSLNQSKPRSLKQILRMKGASDV